MVLLQQFGCCAPSAVLLEVAANHDMLQPALRACLSECIGTFVGIDVTDGPGNVDEPPPAEVGEMANDRLDPGGVVEVDRRTKAGTVASVHKDRRKSRREGGSDLVAIEVGRHNNQAVHPS